MENHEQTHSGEKLFDCKHCERKFRQKNNLKIHERVHTGEKPYICKNCGKQFSNYSKLKCHEKTQHN